MKLLNSIKRLLLSLFAKKSTHENRTGSPIEAPTVENPIYKTPENEPKSFEIVNHRVVNARYVEDPDMGWYMEPKGHVVHFTCSYTVDGTISWFKEKSVDTHLIYDKDGSVVQMVPFNRFAAHAGGVGKSYWKGYNGLNSHFIGHEVLCIGPLTKKGEIYYDYYKRPWNGKVIEYPMFGYKYWEPFTVHQLQAVVAMIKELNRIYNIPTEMVCGHHEASPDRKNDPGGSLTMSMEDFRGLIDG